ncbi:PAO [Symbiodinium natans]|uniref:PAO protein n=1 Tax=Symbiodinium natans TaxID=878477 RepID=A0A812N9L5_9DINO|nr:PAO [Symbiodinium natans]
MNSKFSAIEPEPLGSAQRAIIFAGCPHPMDEASHAEPDPKPLTCVQATGSPSRLDDVLATSSHSADESADEESTASGSLLQDSCPPDSLRADHDPEVDALSSSSGVQVFRSQWDDEGVYFYQAYNDEIAEWAVQHQQFGGPRFNPTRMTWIKPSFAWVLYRSGYGHKHNQTRILKVKLSHASVAELLQHCQCKTGGGGSKGRVQWDPERDLMSGDGKAPRQMLRRRAIQIGLKGSLSELYVKSVIGIEDVTALAHRVHAAHTAADSKLAMSQLLPDLPAERPYVPCCPEPVLQRLRMLPGGGPLHAKPRGKKR